MNKTLYDEAVADAQKLRELAEETAKNKIIEAVMPQIRDLVNKRILGEELDSFDDELSMMPQELDNPGEAQRELDVDDDDEAEAPDVSITAAGDVNIHMESTEDDEDMLLDKNMSEALLRLIRGENESVKTESIESKVDELFHRVKKIANILESIDESDLTISQRKRLNLSFLHCVREGIKLRSEVILTEGKTQERLERRLTKTIKEMKNMSKSNRRNIFDFLFEDEEKKQSMGELEEAELSLELTDEEQEELAAAEDAPAVEDALEDILGDLEVSMEAGEAADEGGEADEEAPAEEEGQAEELDLGEGEHHKEGSYGEADHVDEGEDMDEDMDEVYEIDENMLRNALAQMMTEDAAEEADPAAQHGGEVLGDVLLDIDEEDLINVLADEIGNTDVPPTPAMVAVESRGRRERARVSQRQLAEAKKEIRQYQRAVQGLKGQLVEMNLFNAKLLYANKLMQNKNLTMKQQKAIVEALDNAKTLREAKLLFKSLTESLNRKSSQKLSEGSLRTLGSSSRSTRSAQPASNGVEVDRWGVLAGLNGKD